MKNKVVRTQAYESLKTDYLLTFDVNEGIYMDIQQKQHDHFVQLATFVAIKKKKNKKYVGELDLREGRISGIIKEKNG